MHYDFRQDLAEGEAAEQEVLGRIKPFLRIQGYGYVEEDKAQKTHDLCFINPTKGKPCRVEVKWDQYSKKSGNIAVEFKCSGNWSGIITTEADIWAFKYWHDCWRYRAVGTTFLYEILKGSKRYRTTGGGDHNRARMWLIPVTDFEQWGVKL